MLKRYRYAITPGAFARGRLSRTFGCARVVFNDFVAENRARYMAHEPFLSGFSAMKQMALSKKSSERFWLSEVSDSVLQQSIRDAAAGYRNFFDSVSGKRKGPRVGAPKFKSRRDSKQSARFTRNGFGIRGGYQNTASGGGRLYLAKIGAIPVVWSRPLPADPTSVTITQEADGKFYASFVVDVPQAAAVAATHPGRGAGLDLGLTTYAAVVYTDGAREAIDNPRFFRAGQRRLARTQRSLARKVKGSNNRRKAKLNVARAYRRIANQRLDHAYQVASRLVRENQTISCETLNIRGMAAGRLAKSIHDAGWGQILHILEEKSGQHGRDFHQVPTRFPSSQLCAVCGRRDGPKPLNVRTWVCPGCGTTLDRDFNAATNILIAAGLAEILNACGEDIRQVLASASTAPLEEAGTHPTRNLAAQAA